MTTSRAVFEPPSQGGALHMSTAFENCEHQQRGKYIAVRHKYFVLRRNCCSLFLAACTSMLASTRNANPTIDCANGREAPMPKYTSVYFYCQIQHIQRWSTDMKLKDSQMK